MDTVLDARHLTHRHGSGPPALDDVSLTVAAGEMVALLGPNGAGKTTLVRCAIGSLVADGGSVVVDGGDPCDAATRRRLGVVQQDVGFPTTLTVAEVVRGAAARVGASDADAAAAIAEVELDDLSRHRAGRLSGGQQQRLQLAMGLVARPRLLVLDEPTEGLDVAARHRFWASVAARRARGVGVLLTTHLVDEAAAVADRVVLLDRGRVVADATPADLVRRLPDRHVTAVTDLPPHALATHPGVADSWSADGRLHLTVTAAEDVVRWLLTTDPGLRDLTVTTAGLEQVLLASAATGPGSTGTTPSSTSTPSQEVGA